MIRVAIFASLRESLGTGRTEIPAGPGRVSEVIAALGSQHGEQWLKTLSGEKVLVAVNQTMVNDDHAVADGDEVAFFPPVTGG
ncbi:MAG: MoaD family protein [Proteobacteria bacterium]|nr:MoaD family protein [Pseudomonadota bacterium]